MGKYGALQRVIASHVREEQNNGGSGMGPFYFFVILGLILIGGLILSIEYKKHHTPSPTLQNTPKHRGE